MYRELIISITVIVTLFTVNFFLQDYTKKSVTSITYDLKELKNDLKEKNVENIEPKLSTIKNEWNGIYDKLAAYIEHDELEKVKTNMVAMEGFIEVEDYDTGINELNKSMYVLEHIADKYDFNFINIF